MLKFSNPPTVSKGQKTFKGGDELSAEKLAGLIEEFKELDEKFTDFKDEINEFKTTTKEDIKTQSSWVTGGFIALVFIVIGLLIAVGAMAGDYFTMKNASYQNLVEKINTLTEQNNINAALEQQLKEIKTKYPYIK